MIISLSQLEDHPQRLRPRYMERVGQLLGDPTTTSIYGIDDDDDGDDDNDTVKTKKYLLVRCCHYQMLSY